MPLALILLSLAALALYFAMQPAAAAALASTAGSGSGASGDGSETDPSLGAPAAPATAGLLENLGMSAMSSPRGLRNNNPGNIRASSSFIWQGQIGSDGAFAIFSTVGDGIRAIGVLLKNYQDKYGLSTVRDIISRWAPPSENDTPAYISHVATLMGVGSDASLNLHNPATLASLASAIITHEQGTQPYDAATIAANINRALA